MAPSEAPLNAEAIARAVTGLPSAVFVGGVSGALDAEASALVDKLDPKLEEIKTDINAALELCHSGNEPSAGEWQDDVETLRAGVRSIKTIAVSLLNNTYVAPRAREVSFSTWLPRKAARFEGIAVVPRKACSSLIDWQRSFLLAVRRGCFGEDHPPPVSAF